MASQRGSSTSTGNARTSAWTFHAMPTNSPTQAGGVAWTVPAGWEQGPEHQMRIATYRIHAIAGDPDDAECTVYFYGTGQGGTVEANLDR